MTGRDYSAEDMSYALRLANRGFTFEMIFRALVEKPSGKRQRGSVKYQRILDAKGLDRADAYARRTAQNAIKYKAENPPMRDRVSALVEILRIQGAADDLPWGLYCGPGARRALEGVFALAESLGSLKVGFALRHWAEQVGQDKRAVESHRDTLIRTGWLRRDPGDRPAWTGRYTVRQPRDIQGSRIRGHSLTWVRSECPAPGLGGTGSVGTASLRPGLPPEDRLDSSGSLTIFSPRSHLAHDAFRPDGLGDLGWYVLAALRQPTPIAWMPVITGIPPDDMEDLLAVMARAEIVDVEDGLVTITPETVPALDAFAVRAGTAGEGEGMRELHRGEREAFRSRLRRALNVPEATP